MSSSSIGGLRQTAGIDPLRSEPLRLQGLEHFQCMLSVASFDSDVDRNALGRHVEEETAVRNLQDVRAEAAEEARHAAEKARPVVGGDAEGGDTVVALQFA